MNKAEILLLCQGEHFPDVSKVQWLSALLNAVRQHLSGDKDAFTEDPSAIGTALAESESLCQSLHELHTKAMETANV